MDFNRVIKSKRLAKMYLRYWYTFKEIKDTGWKKLYKSRKRGESSRRSGKP